MMFELWGEGSKLIHHKAKHAIKPQQFKQCSSGTEVNHKAQSPETDTWKLCNKGGILNHWGKNRLLNKSF